MKGLIRYLLHRPTWQKLPVMPRMYSTDYSACDVDEDTQTLMRLTHTRCPQGVEVLKQRHGAKSARQLIEELPARRRKRHMVRRALALLQRALGLTSYDPMKRIYYEHRRATRRARR